MRDKLILLLTILLIIPIGYGAESTILTENFAYTDAFANHDWVYSVPSGNWPNHPVNGTVVGDYAFGENLTNNGAGAGGTRSIRRVLSVGSVDTMTFRYNIVENRGNGNDSRQAFIVAWLNEFQVPQFTLSHGYFSDTLRIANSIGGDDCNMTLGYTIPFEADFIISFDFNNNFYTAYLSNSSGTDTYGCEGITLHNGSVSQAQNSITYLRISEIYEANGDSERYFDSLSVDLEAVNQTGFGVGSPCDSDDDCLSGNCEYTFCTGQKGGGACDSDGDCISGACINDICTKPSIWQSLDASKTQQFGDDEDSNNFIALFFMVGLPFLIMMATRNKAGIVTGIAIYYGLGFFFTIVGWLSAFVILGSVIAGLIIFVFAVMMGRGSD